eukprot:TCONS_00069779-protein
MEVDSHQDDHQLLDWEAKLFLEIMEDDGLLVLAKGLGLDRMFLKVVQTFCKQDNLVFVLNTIPEEQFHFLNELSALDVKHLPKVISDSSVEERRQLYLQGGVFFVSSKILVMDMLTKRVPIDYITGILVTRAHKIAESSQESFILRMFREHNSDGFIKAFSDIPTAFMAGYCQVERVMKLLFIRHLFLRPRFHNEIAACLELHKPDVIEVNIEITPKMRAIQLSLLDLLNISLRELKRAVPNLDPDHFTLENSLNRTFDRMLKVQLDSVWNELANRTKELVSDIRVLRTLLSYLTQYDCVTFYNFLDTLKKNEKNKKSMWMLTDAANTVYVNAKERVMGVPEKDKKGKVVKKGKPEPCPKWEILTEILDEIEKEKVNQDEKKVLVCAVDDRTSYQLSQVLCHGIDSFLQGQYERSALSTGYHSGSAEETDSDFSMNFSKFSDNEKAGDKGKSDEEDNDSKFSLDLNTNPLIIHSLHGSADHYSLFQTLYEFEPTYVVLFDASVEFVRQLEVFKASRPGIPLRVYFLFYSSSIEEQRYLTSLRQEKDAFELLIRQKADMVIPEERQAKTQAAKSSLRDASKASATVVSSRKAGGRDVQNAKTRNIVVDMREFGSELPNMLYCRGIELLPVTLEVGDYILTPDICVERKSVSDLIGSLNNGRLYTQCVSMTRFYRKPVLLIEFNESKSFSLQAKGSLKNEISLQNISSKLTLLTIHFPKLRIIWSQSPQLTAEIFEDLKSNADEPNAEVAMAVGVEGAGQQNHFYNIIQQDLVDRLPGVNMKNCRHILNKFNTMKELMNTDEKTISDVFGNANNAKLLSNFIHKKHDVTQPKMKRRKK